MSLRRLAVVLMAIISFHACTSSKEIIFKTAVVPTHKVSGKIVDNYSGQPVANAKIWIEGTTILVNSNKEGEFELQVPRGYYNVLVKHENYKTDKKKLELVQENETSTLNFEVLRVYPEPSYGSMQSLAGQERKLQKFLDYYIRESKSCKVINPEVITLEPTDDAGVIHVSGPVTLKIENRDLGYLVSVNLQQYIAKNYSGILGLDVEADLLFEEIEPENAEQAKKWKNNREKAFAGSLRHFLIALASDKPLFYFGYRTYSGTFVSSVSSMAFTDSHSSDIEVNKDNILAPYSASNILQFDEELRVEFVDKGVDDPFNITGLKLYPFQTSWLSLNGNYLNFTKNGTVEDRDALQVKGSWRYVPVCKMLPENYLPEVKGDEQS